MTEKVLNAILKGLPTLIGGTGLWQFFAGGTWFGQLILSGFCASISLQLLDAPAAAASLYQQYSGNLILGGATTNRSPLHLVMLLLIAIVWLAHVIFRAGLEARAEQPPPSRLAALYIRFYFPLTILAAVIFLGVAFGVPREFWFGGLVLMFIVATSAYLIMNTKDAIEGSFWPRLTYLTLLLLLVYAFVAFPAAYGRRVFELELQSADLAANATYEPRPGERFYVLNAAQSLYGTIGWYGDRWGLRILDPELATSFVPGDKFDKLRELIPELLPPNAAEVGADAIRAFEEQLKVDGGIGGQ